MVLKRGYTVPQLFASNTAYFLFPRNSNDSTEVNIVGYSKFDSKNHKRHVTFRIKSIRRPEILNSFYFDNLLQFKLPLFLEMNNDCEVDCLFAKIEKSYNPQNAVSNLHPHTNIKQVCDQFPYRWYLKIAPHEQNEVWLKKNSEIAAPENSTNIQDYEDYLLNCYDFESCKIIPKYRTISSGNDVIPESLEVSLTCPISMSRIRLPGKFTFCKHYQCFDLLVFHQCFVKDYVTENPFAKFLKCPICSTFNALMVKL